MDARISSRHNFLVETLLPMQRADDLPAEGGCWCAELPHVLPMPAPGAPSAGCLCRACLLEKINAPGASSDKFSRTQ